MKPIDHSTGTVNRTRPPYQPVVYLHARRQSDDHAHYAEEAVDVCAGAHGEKVVQPNEKGEDANCHGRGHHRAVSKQRLAGEGCDDLGKHAERRQDQDVDFRVSPDPEQVGVQHLIAAAVVCEEMETEITIEQQHREGRGQNWEGGDNEQVRGERGPAENRHAHIAHAWSAHLQYGRGGGELGHGRAEQRCCLQGKVKLMEGERIVLRKNQTRKLT